MRITSRQGIIYSSKDGTGAAQFLLPSSTPGFININVSPIPLLITFAHGSSNYLQAFDRIVTNAWGPFQSNRNSYLYWDIDLLTGELNYGITLLEPIISLLEPTRLNDQHWFNLNDYTFKVWNGQKWIPKIRLFAGKVLNGNVNQIISKELGSQISDITPVMAGFIMFDSQLRPLRTSSGEFLTTETPIHIKTTVGTSGVLGIPPNAFIPIRAGENIPAMSVVSFVSEDTVHLSTPDKIPVGIIQDSLVMNEIGVLTQSGEITYDQWDWTSNIGKPLYINDTGELTLYRHSGSLVYRVGIIKNKNTILLNIDAETYSLNQSVSSSSIFISGTSPIIINETTNQDEEQVFEISINSASSSQDGFMSAAQAILLNNTSSRFNGIDAVLLTKASISHNHTLSSLSDVEFTSISNNQILQYQDGNWINIDLPVFSLSNLIDVSLVNLVPGDVLTWNGTNWIAGTTPEAPITKLIAGSNITLSPSSGLGEVTISASVGSGGGSSFREAVGFTNTSLENIRITETQISDFLSTIGISIINGSSWRVTIYGSCSTSEQGVISYFNLYYGSTLICTVNGSSNTIGTNISFKVDITSTYVDNAFYSSGAIISNAVPASFGWQGINAQMSSVSSMNYSYMLNPIDDNFYVTARTAANALSLTVWICTIERIV